MQKETYREMKARHQAEINALPLAFAFSTDQYKEKLAEWNITEDEARSGAVVGIGNGGFCRAKDHGHFLETMRRIKAEREAAIAEDTTGDGFLYQALKAELINTEYSYTGAEGEALEALGLTWEDLEASDAIRHAMEKATAEIQSAGDTFDE